MFKEYDKDLPFEVNESGVTRNKYTKRLYTPRIRKGYYSVGTTLKSGEKVQRSVHRMVAECFVINPKPDVKVQVNHIDGDKLHNHFTNLEWVTSQENRIHAFNTGLQKPRYGEDCNSTVLTENQARSVCELLEQGYRNVDIEKMTGIDRWKVKDIKRGSAWSQVGCEYNLKANDRPRMSKETVEWVCRQLEEGVHIPLIVNMSTNKAVTTVSVSKIKNRETYTAITDTYNF